MKCNVCHKPITSIFFGTDHYPICQSCFLKLKEDDDYHLYLTLCYEPELIEDGDFAKTLSDYIVGDKLIRELNKEFENDLLKGYQGWKTMNDTKLKPCPFCGGKVLIEIDGRYAKIGCSCCGFFTGKQLGLMDRWNTRPIEDEQAKLIIDLADALINLTDAVASDDSKRIDIVFKEVMEVGVVHKYLEWKDKHAT